LNRTEKLIDFRKKIKNNILRMYIFSNIGGNNKLHPLFLSRIF